MPCATCLLITVQIIHVVCLFKLIDFIEGALFA
jgi:hypothetical protein